MSELNPQEIKRYSRHLILPEVGMAGQKKLKDSAVLLVGTGGLGSPAAMYLAAAGVGRIGLVDYDVVDSSNLQRQVVHGEGTVGQKKVDSAKARLLDLNPHIQIDVYDEALTSDNALGLFEPYDVIADGTDNFPTRYLVNDACVMLKKTNVYASIFRFEGQLTVFDAASDGPCYRCLYPEPPPPGLVPSCAEGGVLGVLPGVMGTLQATEVVKHILGIGDSMNGRLMLFDALEMSFRTLKLRRDEHCVVCSEHATLKELIDYEQFCGVPANDHQVEDTEISEWEITPLQLKEQIDHVSALIDVREPHEWDIGYIEGAKLIPLKTLNEKIDSLPKDQDIIVYCKLGGRSMKALNQLRDAGFTRVRSLAGGINAWSRDVDSSIPEY